jgi:hypothetical protein
MCLHQVRRKVMIQKEADILHIKKNAEALVVANKATGLEVNADKTKYMVMSRDQNAGRSHNIKTDNSSSKGWKISYIWEQL